MSIFCPTSDCSATSTCETMPYQQDYNTRILEYYNAKENHLASQDKTTRRYSAILWCHRKLVPRPTASGDRGGSFSSCRFSCRRWWRCGRIGVQLVSSLVLRLELVCHRRQATIGQQGQAASQKITTTNTFGHQLSNHKYILNLNNVH